MASIDVHPVPNKSLQATPEIVTDSAARITPTGPARLTFYRSAAHR